MSLEKLENLVKIHKLKNELSDRLEFKVILNSAKNRLKDANIKGLSDYSKFDLAYNAAHALALVALRRQGYRPENRSIAFQCLQHTVGLESLKCRVLVQCDEKVENTEFEGCLEISPNLLSELIAITEEVLLLVELLDEV